MADAKRVDAGSGIAGIADLLNLFGGKTSTTKNSADTTQLQQILAQLQGQDPAAMLSSIFSQAAGQMPGLQARFSNAVGARSSGNSAVQGALSKLLQDTVLRGQQQVMQQQLQSSQVQGDIAGKISQLNSRQTTNAGTNMQKAAQGLAGLQLAGKLFDSDLGKKAKDVFGGLFSSDTGAADTGSLTGAADTGGFNFDLGPLWENAGGGDAFALSGADVTGDLAAGFGDWFTSGGDAVTSEAGDGSFLEDLSGLFGFAEGGLVGRDGEKSKTKGYADGGEVTQRAAGGRRSAAPTYTPEQILQAIAVQMQATPRQQQQSQDPRELPGMAGDSETESGNGFSLGSGIAGNIADAQNGKVAEGFAKAMLGMMSPVSIPGFTKNPLSAIVTGIKTALAQQRSEDAINEAVDPISALSIEQGWITPDAVQAMDTNSIAAAANAISALTSTDSLDAMLGYTNAFGTDMSGGGIDPSGEGLDAEGHGYNAGKDSSAANGDGGAGAGGDGGYGGYGGFGNGGAGDGGGDGSGGGMKNGGRVPGKPDHTGGDTVNADLTRGEYVLPVDVVEAVGVQFLDNLRAMFHEQVGV